MSLSVDNESWLPGIWGSCASSYHVVVGQASVFCWTNWLGWRMLSGHCTAGAQVGSSEPALPHVYPYLSCCGGAGHFRKRWLTLMVSYMEIRSLRENLSGEKAASCIRKVVFIFVVFQLAKSNHSFTWFLKAFIWGLGLVLHATDLGNTVCFGISVVLSDRCKIYDWFDEVKAGMAFLLAEHLSGQFYTAPKNYIRLEQSLI